MYSPRMFAQLIFIFVAKVLYLGLKKEWNKESF